MRKPKRKGRGWRRLLRVLAVLVILVLVFIIYMVQVSKVDPPTPGNVTSLQWQRTEVTPGFYTLNNSWFRKSKSGLYELYVEGDAFERGVVNGKLTKELVVRQEDHFTEQISKMIPSKFYLRFLKYFVGWFNRHLSKNVTEEYKEEIYGISQSASENYQYIGTKYQRILNYHSAHDIGHALQNMMLVGCTSFGTWDAQSKDSSMIIGRNFDFYVGDKFAEDKIVAFVNPKEGYKFMSVTWGGFIGVVSGMNEKGLTVTINAAKSSIPSGSATPVSLVAREILQYARNIQEAVAIARRRTMFVSESFLVGAAEDHKAVIIEKTPDTLDVYDPHSDRIVCANHFQSNILGKSALNKEQMNESASAYRYDRLVELLNRQGPNTVEKTVAVLRDYHGSNNSDIGIGNEKALNQFIAHHSIVFEPQKRLVYVSTAPWQMGRYIAYDLNKVFGLRGMKEDREICDSSRTIAADSFLLTDRYQKFRQFRTYAQRIADKQPVNVDSMVADNPAFYHAYVLAGDYLYKQKQYQQAMLYYKIALTKEIATSKERQHVEEQVKKCEMEIEK